MADEGSWAEQDRRVDHPVTGRDDPEHGQDNDEPRRHGDQQRPRDRVSGGFDQERRCAIVSAMPFWIGS